MQLNEYIDALNKRIVTMRAEVKAGQFNLTAFLALVEELVEAAMVIMQAMRDEHERTKCTCGMRQ